MATTKITKTTTGQYDQIFALSQGYLNKSFTSLWNNTTTEFHALKVKNILGSIDAAIGPPEVVLDISPGDKYVLFNINTLSGKLKLRDVDSGDYINGMPSDGFDLTGCKISFKVGITGETLDPKDPAHQDIVDRLHEDASNYSLSRLYMDLTTADLTNFNGTESILPKAITDSNSNWMEFFHTWMTAAHNAKVNTLGYKLTALDSSQKPKTIDATFLPIFNQFQICEWRSESDHTTAQGIPAGDNNCLLYLQMTEFSDVPQDLHYNYTGNMVDAGESGTLFISRKLFWDRWLLRQLTILNYKTLLVATGAHCSNNEIDPDWGWWWKIGKDAADNAGRQDEKDPFYAWKPKSTGLDGPYGFTFENSSHWDDHGGALLSKLECSIDCSTKNEITFVPGSGTINIKGHIYCRIYRWTTAAGSGSAEVNSDWSFDIQMTQITATSETNQSLVPGGVIAKVVNENIPDPSFSRDSSSWGPQTPPDGAKDDVGNAIKNLGLAEIANQIEAGLSGLGHFILPGNGTFNMTNPVLNNNGDFLCHLEYLPETSGPQVANRVPKPAGGS